MKSKILPIILILFFVSSCGTVNKGQNTTALENDPEVRAYSIQSVLWQQNAGEYRALCYQAFNIAQFRLDAFLAQEELQGKKLAIITDIDETVMDNSPYNAKLILDNKEYTPDDWTDWVEREEAIAVPGAEEFLNYAKTKGVEVFYISNRLHKEKAATINNMKKINFPFADEEHTLFKGDQSAKDDRFDKVKSEYTVLLFLGDNLSDFSGDFIVASSTKRNLVTDDNRAKFGMNYIVLPNPMYGDWESYGIYKGRYDWTYPQKDSIWKSNLRAY